MASGLFALLDDIATLMDDVAVMSKIAAKKTAGILGGLGYLGYNQFLQEPDKDFIYDKITIVDTNAAGYVPQKMAHYLAHLENHTGSKMVEWNQRERLKVLLE